MDLNMFINTFELITEERHSLEQAHLSGGETIAFEMLQGEQVCRPALPLHSQSQSQSHPPPSKPTRLTTHHPHRATLNSP